VQPTGQLPPIHPGHEQVQNHVRPLLRGHPQGLGPRVGGAGVIPDQAEQYGQTVGRVGVIIHYQDGQAGVGCRSSGASRA
jgi:hypothetical protein